jgi:chemotaxis protein methyltransferase CheR
MTQLEEKTELAEIELALLIEGIYRRYGIDLRSYERDELQQRIFDRLPPEGVQTISALQEKVLHERDALERLLLALVNADQRVFSDPDFYGAFRTLVVPLLRTYPYVRIWHAGCATGADVYATAIILAEEGLYQRSRIYATELSREAVNRARSGVFSLAEVPQNTSNYLRAGGKKYLSDYFTTHAGQIFFNPELKRNIIFSEHNLATDGSFNEFQVVLCRNVMPHFNPELQERVHELIYESLAIFGVLGLGRRESLRYSPREVFYEALDEKNRIYRKAL